MSFLKAEWNRLVLLNYEIDPQLLESFVPYKTELDTWNNTHYVSLVGFMFQNTKVLGVKVPFHVNFEEINLRFYVRYKEGDQWKRGVVFIKEIVPKAAITLIANKVYREHYVTRNMFHKWESQTDGLYTEYGFFDRSKKQFFSVHSSAESKVIKPGSETEFITEHYWGYARNSARKTIEYEVTHPKWKCFEVQNHSVALDFAAIYGKEFAVLNNAAPLSVMLAEGSEITVESRRILK